MHITVLTHFCHFNYVKIIVVIEVQSIGGIAWIFQNYDILMFNNQATKKLLNYTQAYLKIVRL